MKPYPKYKPSGVAWLGNMPAHWEIKAARFVMSCNDEVLLEDTASDYELNYVEISDVDEVAGLTGFESVLFKDAPSRARRIAQHDDIIISTVRTYLRAIAVIKNPPVNLVVSTGFAVLRPQTVNAGYARYAVAYDGFIQEVIARSKGVSYPAINASELVRIALPVPSLDEQQAIADYLDTETARIDALIREKLGLIGLLGERRQSDISDALLRGKSDAVTRSSGIAWLGDVPKAWTLCRMKHAIQRIAQGWSPECENRLTEGDEWGVLKAGACNHGKFAENEHKTLPKALEPNEALEVHAGDVLMSRASGSADLVGSVAYVEQVQPRLMLSDKLFRLIPEDHVDACYLAWLLNTADHRRQIAGCIRGAEGLARNITTTDIKEFWLALPPLAEQQKLVSVAKRLAVEIDSLIRHAKVEIALLKELRAATIADAVLGRVDVRTG